MNIRRGVAIVLVAAMGWSVAFGAMAAEARPDPGVALRNWYGLVLELVRHTATYTPPVAARALAYLGVTAYEATASGSTDLVSLAGQLNGLEAVPPREPGATYDELVVLDAAMGAAVATLFFNTGPTGQHAIAAAAKKWSVPAAEGVPADVVERSVAYGHAVAAHIGQWSLTDGGSDIQNMGFPLQYDLPKGDGKWVPTSLVALQQLPLLPNWGNNRTFATPEGTVCPLPEPIAYSEDKDSEFYKEALEVYDTVKNATPEQLAIARFWSDDPMLSPTPPGHWVSLVLQIADQKQMSIGDTVDVLARLGVTASDAFVGCWHEKYRYNLLRPLTYIRKLIDPKWDPILITPPFPEYPSGHSTVSGRNGDGPDRILRRQFCFRGQDRHRDGRKPRSFKSFWDAANEAGISRLYGGIHFRAAIERGLDQGRCIGAYTVALRTRK